MVICFRDRTFCSNTDCIKECPDRLTEEIYKQAEEMGLNVSVACYTCNKEDTL